ncbi:MAG: porin [Bacteroidales bacterium]|nr:porin [Bacteroidales bacterium]
MILIKSNFRLKKCLIILFLLISSACFKLFSQDTIDKRTDYIPDIFGILKTKGEFDLDNSLMRFEVRNARFGATGKINSNMSYKIEIDLSDEGRMKMLDAYVKFMPVRNLSFYLGQKKIPFSTDYMRNPAENLFANRSFLAKYINDGMRDIGFYAEYGIEGQIPVNILVAAVNGTGNNNPQWIEKPNLAGRLTLGPEKGIRITGNIYQGNDSEKKNLSMLGGEIRYTNGTFFIESEYIKRRWDDSLSVKRNDDGFFIHSYYNFPSRGKMIHLITPVIRYDLIGKSVFRKNVDADRLTVGINLGFEPRQFYSEIRLNYENYFKSSLPIHTDKLTLEFIARF